MSLGGGSAVMAAAGRCLTGGLSGCLLPITGIGSLGLLLLLLLLLAGASQSMASAFVGFAPQRPHFHHGNYYQSPPPPPHNHAFSSAPPHNYQLAVFGPGSGSRWHHSSSSSSYQRAPVPTYSTTISHSPATSFTDFVSPVSPVRHSSPTTQTVYTSPATLVSEHLSPVTPVLHSSPKPAPTTYLPPTATSPTSGNSSYSSSTSSGLAEPHVIVPALSQHYGVPDSDILSAQASVSDAEQRLPDLQAQNKPRTKPQKTEPLELDVIPAQGPDYPDDGCARNEVRMPQPPGYGGSHGGYGSWKRWNPCQPLLEQGDCPDGHWVVVDKYTRTGVCARRLCPDGFVFVEDDGLCYDATDTSICPGNRRPFLSAFGDHSCGCGDGEYLDKYDVCRKVYSSDTCPYNQQLRFNEMFKLQCQPAACPPEKPINFNGWCKAFGDPCGDSRFILGFDTTRLEPKCYPVEELDPSSSRSTGSQSKAPPTESVSASPVPTPSVAVTTKAPVDLPHLNDGYLPPPGQFTQYAARRGLWDAGWVDRGRSTLAQWLGFGRRRGPPTRRRRPPPPPPPPQHQQALLDPWSRLDIDQVTFVDSERVSSAELALQRRSGRNHHRRYKRQIFSKVPLLNSCRPGARSGFNFKCRDKILPGDANRQPRGPIIPTNAPNCGPGERLDAQGRCRATFSGLG